jgi:hypothetical protein
VQRLGTKADAGLVGADDVSVGVRALDNAVLDAGHRGADDSAGRLGALAIDGVDHALAQAVATEKRLHPALRQAKALDLEDVGKARLRLDLLRGLLDDVVAVCDVGEHVCDGGLVVARRRDQLEHETAADGVLEVLVDRTAHGLLGSISAKLASSFHPLGQGKASKRLEAAVRADLAQGRADTTIKGSNRGDAGRLLLLGVARHTRLDGGGGQLGGGHGRLDKNNLPCEHEEGN